MRVAGGDEYAELAELGGGLGAAPRGRRIRPGAPAEAEDALGSQNSPRRPRSGLYYSPPGTSYTIVERPSSALHHHREYREREREHHYSSLSSPRGTVLLPRIPLYDGTKVFSSPLHLPYKGHFNNILRSISSKIVDFQSPLFLQLSPHLLVSSPHRTEADA